MSARITVAICTRNRSGMLDRCLAALAREACDRGECCVLVVDNGSTDETGAVIARWLDRWPDGRLSCAREEAPGLSRARNRALAEAATEIVAFLDDDAMVMPGWLAAVLASTAEPGAAAIWGGPIALEWRDGRPDWFDPCLASYFSELDLGAADRALGHGLYPYGANFWVCRSAALAVGGFDTRLGFAGRGLVAGEETDLAQRLEAAGYEVRYGACAGVRHVITAGRSGRAWLLRRAYGGGLAEARGRTRGATRGQSWRVAMDSMRWWRHARALSVRTRGMEPETTVAQVRRARAAGLVRGALDAALAHGDGRERTEGAPKGVRR